MLSTVESFFFLHLHEFFPDCDTSGRHHVIYSLCHRDARLCLCHRGLIEAIHVVLVRLALRLLYSCTTYSRSTSVLTEGRSLVKIMTTGASLRHEAWAGRRSQLFRFELVLVSAVLINHGSIIQELLLLLDCGDHTNRFLCLSRISTKARLVCIGRTDSHLVYLPVAWHQLASTIADDVPPHVLCRWWPHSLLRRDCSSINYSGSVAC